MTGRFVCWALVAVACSSARIGASEKGEPSVTVPARFAEGERSADAGAPSTEAQTPAKPKVDSAPPDPTPLRSSRQWKYVFRHRDGRVTVESVGLMIYSKPVETVRQIGRYAVELWIGHELIERVRFDFPGLAAEPPPTKRRPLAEPPSLAPGADVAQTVLVPASERATRAVLFDRATGETQALPWPPDAPLGAAR